MIGRTIEYKNTKKGLLQKGEIVDKVVYFEKVEDTQPVTGYLVEESETKTMRVVKSTKLIRFVD